MPKGHDFFAVFYRRLAAGESVASARRERYEAGDPAQTWAGPVFLGTGDPRIAAPKGARAPVGIAAALASGALVAALAWLWKRRRS